MNLSDKMKAEAVNNGLCQQWTKEWKDNTSKDEMVEKFVRGIDFCIKHNWPSPEDMEKDFGDVIHNHSVYVNEKVELNGKYQHIILNGDCDADITIDGGFCDIYVRHSSRANITVKGRALVIVSLLDGADVITDMEDGAQMTIFDYGPDTSFRNHKDVVVKNRHGFWEKKRKNA